MKIFLCIFGLLWIGIPASTSGEYVSGDDVLMISKPLVYQSRVQAAVKEQSQ